MAKQSFLDLQGLTNVVTKVKQFVLDKADWIIEKKQEVTMRQNKKRTHSYTSGDGFNELQYP